MPIIGSELLVGFTIGAEDEEGEKSPYTPSGERLYASVPSVFVNDGQTGFFGKLLCDSVMSMMQDLDLIVRDSPAGIHPITQQAVPGMLAHPGWSAIVDPKVCPEAWLAWCAALYGVVLVGNTTAAQQRQQIEELPPQKRGGLTAMLKAAKETLTGNQSIVFIEQSNGESYLLTAHTELSETPNEALTREALLSQKPAGLQLVYSASSTPTWLEATKKWSEVAAGVTWANVKSGQV